MIAGIRTDASPRIGTGHLMRCLTLADALREQGVQSMFIMRAHELSFFELVRQRGHDVLALPATDTQTISKAESSYADWLGATQEQDAGQTVDILATLGSTLDWLVVDHYALDTTWESQIRKYARRLLVIDDLANRPHDCDLLLDQNLYENMNSRYTGLIPRSTVGLYGPRYALLRSEFAQTRARLRKRDGTIHRVLVFFGGADLADMTGKTIEAISDETFHSIQFDIVIGSANPFREKLMRQAGQLPNVRLHTHVECMSDLMSAADLAIGGAGTTTWERCCLGLPTILVVLAENQREVAQMLHTSGLAISIGDHTKVMPEQMKHAVKTLMSDKESMRTISQRCLETVDGFGAGRVVDYMMKRTNTDSSVRPEHISSER